VEGNEERNLGGEESARLGVPKVEKRGQKEESHEGKGCRPERAPRPATARRECPAGCQSASLELTGPAG
jgi:hypothetical protein